MRKSALSPSLSPNEPKEFPVSVDSMEIDVIYEEIYHKGNQLRNTHKKSPEYKTLQRELFMLKNKEVICPCNGKIVSWAKSSMHCSTIAHILCRGPHPFINLM